MSSKTRTILIGTIIGVILGLLLGISIGSIVWYRNNPPISEIESVLEENLNLTEEQLARATEMAQAGAVIDLVIHILVATWLAVCLGAGLGSMGGLLWYRIKVLPIETIGTEV